MASAVLPLSRLLAHGRDPEFVVCREENHDVPWRAFASRVGGIARALAREPRQRWLITCSAPLDFVAALLAVLHEGRRAVIPPSFQPGMIEQMRPAYDAVLGDDPAASVRVRDATPAAADFGALDAQRAAIDLYTSGSSALPKQVQKSLAQLETEAQALEACWGEALGDATVHATVPHHHIYGLLFQLLWPLCAGRRFDALTCADPQVLLERVRESGAAAIVSSPAHLTRLPDLIALAALKPFVRGIYSSGAPLPRDTALEFQRALGCSPTEVYGSTETGGIAWRRQGPDPDHCAWTPFAGIGVGAGEDGGLLLRSPYLATGDPIAVADAVKCLPDGRFLLEGRLDRIVKVEGKRLSLPNMEERLCQHPWVRDAGVVLLPGRKQLLGAVVILRERRHAEVGGRARLAEALRRHLSAWFEPVLLPRHWRFPAQLPVDERGKLTPTALAGLFREARDEAPAA